MTARRFLAVVALAALVATAGCFAGGTPGNETVAPDEGDDAPDETPEDALPDDGSDDELTDNETSDEVSSANETAETGPAGDETAGEGSPANETGDDALPDGETLLQRTVAAESTVESLRGVQTTTWTDGNESVSTTYEVWLRPPNETRMELVSSDQPDQFDVLVSNGTTLWTYDEDANEAVRLDPGFSPGQLQRLQESFAEAFLGDMTPTAVGTDTVAGRDAYVVELTPRNDTDSLYESATVWIDRETNYTLKQVGTTGFGRNVTIDVTYEEIRFGVEIPDDRFTFEPPDDAEVLNASDFTTAQYADVEQAEAAVPFDLPEHEVPAGYELDTVVVTENLDGWAASFRYVGENETLLTVGVRERQNRTGFAPQPGESIEIDGVNATVTELPGADLTSIQWEEEDLAYTVSGELPREDLRAVAESIVE